MKAERQHYREALTKRALARLFLRGGVPKREAEAAVARLPHREQWGKLPPDVQSEIAWKVGGAYPPKPKTQHRRQQR